MTDRSIAIVGCGPCGLAAALLLHRAGEDVTLFERFEAPRPIGSGLMIQPTGMAVLTELGLGEQIRREGAQIDRLLGMAGRRTVLDVSYANLHQPGLSGVGLHRASLFSALFEACVAEGVPLQTGRAVIGSQLTPEGRALQFDDEGQSKPFALVIDASGTRSTLAPPTGYDLTYGALWASVDWVPHAGLDSNTLSQRYRRSSVMAGILPTGPGNGPAPRAAFFWSLRADRWQAWQASGLAAWKAEVLALWPQCAPFVDQIHDLEQLAFARYAHRTLPLPAEPRLVHLGDAWHSASPQLGQGANMALLDAWALARCIVGEADLDAAARAAVAVRQPHVKLYQGLTWLFTPVYQSDSQVLPFLRDWLVGPISKLWPATAIQAAMVSGLIGKPLGPLGLTLTTKA